MKELIQPFLDLIKNLVQPEKGTKFLVTVAAIGAIFFMHKYAISTMESDIVIGGLAAVYYIADIHYKTKLKENNTVPEVKP